MPPRIQLTLVLNCWNTNTSNFVHWQIGIFTSRPSQCARTFNVKDITWTCLFDGSWTIAVPLTLRSKTPLVPKKQLNQGIVFRNLSAEQMTETNELFKWTPWFHVILLSRNPSKCDYLQHGCTRNPSPVAAPNCSPATQQEELPEGTHHPHWLRLQSKRWCCIILPNPDVFSCEWATHLPAMRPMTPDVLMTSPACIFSVAMIHLFRLPPATSAMSADLKTQVVKKKKKKKYLRRSSGRNVTVKVDLRFD